MVKVVVTGAAGRMGREIITSLDSSKEAKLCGAVEAEGNPAIGKDAGELSGLSACGVRVGASFKKAIERADVAIDFSSPKASVENVECATGLGKDIVVGTTGVSEEQRERVRKASESAPVVLAPNMSVGVNLLLRLVSEAAKVLGDSYDLEILEAHHRHKADAPSGTALRIAEVAAKALNRDLDKVAVYERKGIIGERKSEEIGIQTLRAGDIVGDHTVLFGGDGERIELTHRAHSRSTFANGAVRAALWLDGKKQGLYDMQDVLGFK